MFGYKKPKESTRSVITYADPDPDPRQCQARWLIDQGIQFDVDAKFYGPCSGKVLRVSLLDYGSIRYGTWSDEQYACEFHIPYLYPATQDPHAKTIDKLRELVTVATEAADMLSQLAPKEKP
jgi:hypothetical protein